jgi:hypothetical protein
MSLAVLLDSCTAASLQTARDERAALVRERRRLCGPRNPMEPLLAQLVSSFLDDADLSRRLASVYQVPRNPPLSPSSLSLSAC